jgi:hypothetical protein
MIDEVQRRRLVRVCLWMTRGTALAADGYELRLLVQFIQGRLTIDQVCDLVDNQPAPLLAVPRPTVLQKSRYLRPAGFPPKSGPGAAAPAAG